MNKILTVLLFSIMLGFSGCTYSASDKPLSPQKMCVAQANVQFEIAKARSSVSPVEIAMAMWESYDSKTISELQLATALTWVINIYSSPVDPGTIKEQAYNECMKTTGKSEV